MCFEIPFDANNANESCYLDFFFALEMIMCFVCFVAVYRSFSAVTPLQCRFLFVASDFLLLFSRWHDGLGSPRPSINRSDESYTLCRCLVVFVSLVRGWNTGKRSEVAYVNRWITCKVSHNEEPTHLHLLVQSVLESGGRYFSMVHTGYREEG